MASPKRWTSLMKGAAAWLSRPPHGPEHTAPASVAIERLSYADRYRTPQTSSLYCGVLSTVVRSYIEDQFHMPAREMTTTEFLAGLRDNAPMVLQRNRSTLERVLACCDIAQTDRYELSDAELRSARDAALHLIAVTRGDSVGLCAPAPRIHPPASRSCARPRAAG